RRAHLAADPGAACVRHASTAVNAPVFLRRPAAQSVRRDVVIVGLFAGMRCRLPIERGFSREDHHRHAPGSPSSRPKLLIPALYHVGPAPSRREIGEPFVSAESVWPKRDFMNIRRLSAMGIFTLTVAAPAAFGDAVVFSGTGTDAE